MNLENANKLIPELASSTVVVDVGGGASPFPRVDYVLDFLDFDSGGEESSGSIHRHLGISPRYNRYTWISGVDLCGHAPSPFPYKFFDFGKVTLAVKYEGGDCTRGSESRYRLMEVRLAFVRSGV